MEFPQEIILKILWNFVPIGPPTGYFTDPEPKAHQRFIDGRTTLWNACRASRQLAKCSTNALYHTVIIRNCNELLFFFRTLRNVPTLRGLVRSFAWVGALSQFEILDTNFADLISHTIDVCTMLARNERPPEEDGFVNGLLGLRAGNIIGIRGWGLLGAVLFMIPRTVSLFIVLRKAMLTPVETEVLSTYLSGRLDREASDADMREWLRFHPHAMDALRHHATMGFPPWSPPPSSIVVPPGFKFLPELESLTIDSYPKQQIPDIAASTAIHAFLPVCSRLRYINVTGGTYMKMLADSPFESVQELALRDEEWPFVVVTAVSTMFPNLTSLRISFSDGTKDRADISHGGLDALLNLKNLTYLSLTASPNADWNDPDLAHMLSPFLREMKSLKALRTDLIWLAHRKDPSEALNIAALLPPALSSLSLVDYWGVCVANSRLGQTYHPVFPFNAFPADFICQVLDKLLQDCARLPNLKDVKFFSPLIPMLDTQWCGFPQRFQEIGVCFTPGPLLEVELEEVDLWYSHD